MPRIVGYQRKKRNIMKKTLFLTLLILCSSSAMNNYLTPEILAEKVFKSLQENDFEAFKDSCPKYEVIQKLVDMTAAEYDARVKEVFAESQKEFTEKNYSAADFELIKVNEPYKRYEHKGFEYIRYNVIIKNQEDIYLELNFSDCIKTPDGYRLGEVIRVSAM